MEKIVLFTLLILLAGCETAYCDAWEQVGVHKRDILVDRIDETQEAQEKTQGQFNDALEPCRPVVSFDGGDLEKRYNKLNAHYEDSDQAAKAISGHIDSV
ncbi:MAG: hypothetical protein ACI89Z_000471 [Porticoccus sp.]|jgi:hypothetical protein